MKNLWQYQQKQLLVMSEDLNKIRILIDKIDKQIVKSLNNRADLAKKIKKAKASSEKKDIFRPEREAQILRKIASTNEGPLTTKHLQAIFREIISSCLSLETDLKVSCLGPQESYSHLALNKFFGSSVKIKFNNSISEIFDDVCRQNIDFGIVPIENSNQGSIKETIEHLIKDNSQLCGEVNLDIKHCLLSNSKKMSEIKKVYAHEQTFLQCNQWLNKNMPNIQRIFASSNSAAVQKIIKLKNSAAIASKNCGPVYKVGILKNNIHDSIDNTTRFIVIGNHNIAASGSDKTSILISIDNKAGSLNELLLPLSKNKISMSKIESIPTRINNWEYMFLLDIDGHVDDKVVGQVLKEIQKKTSFYKNLGSYPKSI
jgi:chorismate mutase/prephenate dehydratase